MMRTATAIATIALSLYTVSPTHARQLPPSTRLRSTNTALLSADSARLFAQTTEQTLIAVDVTSGDLVWSRPLTEDHLELQLLTCDGQPQVHRIVEFRGTTAALVDVDSRDGMKTVLAETSVKFRNGKPTFEQVLTSSSTGRSTYLWIEASRLFYFDLNEDSFGESGELENLVSSISEFGFEDMGFTLLHREDGTSIVLRLLGDGRLEEVWQFSRARQSLVASKSSIELRANDGSGHRVLWRHQVDQVEQIERLAEQSSDTMLSPGRVNADRTSVFKYRNPNVLAVVVSTLDAVSNLSIRLLSLDNGDEVGRFHLPFTADTSDRIGIAMVEDWIVCTFRTRSLDVPIHVLVSTYLAQLPDTG
ncbi:hypothetical protein JCM11491_005158 [Sporobolomyces phaffii]